MSCTFTARRQTPAIGCRKGALVKVVTAFDEETFQQIRSLAISKNTSVAEQIRQLVEFGLIDVGES